MVVTMRWFKEMMKLKGVYAVGTGLIYARSLGTHYLFISSAIMVSDVLMKIRLGKKRELCTDSGEK